MKMGASQTPRDGRFGLKECVRVGRSGKEEVAHVVGWLGFEAVVSCEWVCTGADVNDVGSENCKLTEVG